MSCKLVRMNITCNEYWYDWPFYGYFTQAWTILRLLCANIDYNIVTLNEHSLKTVCFIPRILNSDYVSVYSEFVDRPVTGGRGATTRL